MAAFFMNISSPLRHAVLSPHDATATSLTFGVLKSTQSDSRQTAMSLAASKHGVRHMKRFLIHAFILMTVVLMSTGCSSMIYTSNYDSYITEQVRTYTYPSSELPRLWQNAMMLIRKQGFHPREFDQYRAETEWVNMGSYDRKYYLVSYTSRTNGTHVEFTYTDLTHTQPGVTPARKDDRDYAMEFELMRMMNADDWSRIKAEAEAYAQSKVSQ